jgi:hypothetical protein
VWAAPLSHDCCTGSLRYAILRERIVTTPKEYRDYADECFGWAKTAKSNKEREFSCRWPEFGLKPLRERKPAEPHPILKAPRK